MKKLFGISLIVLFLDQMIKGLIGKNMIEYQSFAVINGFFHITYAKNDGAAWSILSGNRLLLITVAFIALLILYHYFLKGKNLKWIEITTYGLLIGGIIGNLWDRIFHGYVIDYLDFTILKYPFPIFNFADICIVVGVLLLIYEILRGETKWKL